MDESPYRREYVEALTLLAHASARVRARGYAAPILVGGAVVEFDTGSQIVSGDFDFVSSSDGSFARALVEAGLEQGDGRSMRRMAFVHPELGFGVEIVSGQYFDGLADRDRVRLVHVGDADVSMAPTEDLIADRLGQWVASDRKDHRLFYQAKTLFRLAEELETAYLDKRIRQETDGELDLNRLSRLCDENIDVV